MERRIMQEGRTERGDKGFKGRGQEKERRGKENKRSTKSK